jgi:hypothetical protein
MTKPTIGGGQSSPPGARDFVPQRAIAGTVIRLLLISATARHCDTSKTPMPELANIRDERFIQGVVNGLTGAEAYRRVAGSNSKIPAAPTPRLRHVLAGQGVHRTEFCRDLDARRHREGVRGRCPYLCRLFARFHNESPYQFLKRLRSGARLAESCWQGTPRRNPWPPRSGSRNPSTFPGFSNPCTRSGRLECGLTKRAGAGKSRHAPDRHPQPRAA